MFMESWQYLNSGPQCTGEHLGSLQCHCDPVLQQNLSSELLTRDFTVRKKKNSKVHQRRIQQNLILSLKIHVWLKAVLENIFTITCQPNNRKIFWIVAERKPEKLRGLHSDKHLNLFKVKLFYARLSLFFPGVKYNRLHEM